MLKDKLIENIQKMPSRPGTFREKDLLKLFQQCSQAYKSLIKLQEEKQKLEQKKANMRIVMTPNKPQSQEKEKIKSLPIDSLKKKGGQYKIKCQIKSCGKIMYSQASFNIHMKKHAEKKNRKDQSHDSIQ